MTLIGWRELDADTRPSHVGNWLKGMPAAAKVCGKCRQCISTQVTRMSVGV